VIHQRKVYIMAIKLNPTKANIVISLLKTNSNRFTIVQLLKSAGNERRARSALSHARMAGVTLEAVRDGGRAVIAYIASGSVPTVNEPVAKAKASKAASPKAAAKVRVTKPLQKSVAAAVTKTDEEIKAKNLATMKAVTKREKTALDKVKEDTRAEFDALEAEWEAEEAARAEQLAARVAVSENLPRANVLAD
jgi:hypothetical protein